jgi:actin-like ATPase involved in cell morphogenesis
MKDTVSVGVDFGSTGVRAAVLDDTGEAIPVSYVPPPNLPWLLCQPTASGLGMRFPSMKSRLGGGQRLPLLGEQRQPGDAAESAFRALRLAVEAQTAKRVDHAVVAVPARYLASQRTALCEAVLAAGFAEAHLINDSMAAVMNSTGRRGTASTSLVFGMGYTGFEVGLVRVARGHYRGLGYEGGSVPAGQALDECLLRGFFETLAQHNLRIDTTAWDVSTWMKMRAKSERLKEILSARSKAPFTVRGPRGNLDIWFNRADLERVVDQWLQGALSAARRLLEQTEVSISHLDAVLLVGGTARIPFVQATVEKAFDAKPSLTATDVLARGAALYAAHIGELRQPSALDVERVEVSGEEPDAQAAQPEIGATVEASQAGQEIATGPGEQPLHVTDVPNRPPEAPAPHRVLDHARELIESGHATTARDFLEGVIREAQALLARIPASKPAIDPRSRRAIARATQLIKEGQYEAAVRESHLAWQASVDSAEIFEKMIDIHIQAATANTTVDAYTDTLRWLMCAYRHDEGNARVRQLLSDRHYLQAKQLAERGRRKDATQSLEACLSLDPEHAHARELQHALTRR